MNIETSLQNTWDHEYLANRPRIKCRLWQKAQNSAGHKVHETSPSLKMGNLGRKESGIIILGNLDEVCLHRQQNVTRSLIKFILSFWMECRYLIFISLHWGDTPVRLTFLVLLVLLCEYNNLYANNLVIPTHACIYTMKTCLYVN